MRRFFSIIFSILLVITPVSIAMSDDAPAGEGSDWRAHPGDTRPQDSGIPEFIVPPPPLSEGIFPCSDCHADQETNPNRRELTEMHEDIKIINHAEDQRWCLDCHNPDDRDYLRLASGKLVSFEESYLLCGQCHGTIFRDWKAGIHGRRTGDWNGKKLYRLCVHCHNPHQPRFKPIAPKPPPVKPKDIK